MSEGQPMKGKEDNVTHASAAVITLALKQLEETDTVDNKTRVLLTQARDSLKSLCPECVQEAQDGTTMFNN